MSRIEILNYNAQEGIATIKVYDPLELDKWQEATTDRRKFGYIEPLAKDTTTDEQRKHWYAIIKDISNHTGDTQGKLIRTIKLWFTEIYDYTKEVSVARNKMSRADATRLLECALEYALMAGAPLNNVYIDDKTERMLHAMTMHRICWICNKPNADLHHAENTVGMGRNRQMIDHTQSKFMTLCRGCHNKAHTMGQKSFEEHYHVKPIKLKHEDLIKLGVM